MQHHLEDAQAQRRYIRRAFKAAEGVILDLKDLVGVEDVSTAMLSFQSYWGSNLDTVLNKIDLILVQEDLRECRVWFARLGY
jgi:hypothetical protein